MNEKQLVRNLRSVGMTCFVKYFELFASETMDRADVIEILKSETPYTEKSCVSRTSHARSIIRAGLAAEALRMVVQSESCQVDDETRRKAQALLFHARMSGSICGRSIEIGGT